MLLRCVFVYVCWTKAYTDVVKTYTAKKTLKAHFENTHDIGLGMC